MAALRGTVDRVEKFIAMGGSMDAKTDDVFTTSPHPAPVPCTN
jgi:hypothetical protein